MKICYIFMYVLYCSGTFAQTDNVVNSIRKAVEQINADKSLTTKTLDNEQFLEQTTDRGGQLTGYFKNGILVKIVERIGLSSCVDINEYYIQDNKLIFVYAQGKEFKYIDSSATFNSSFQTVTMECRFYFQEDKLLKSVLSGSTRCEGKPSESWFKKYQDKYVRYVLLLTNE